MRQQFSSRPSFHTLDKYLMSSRPSPEQRRELGSFLSSRRARLQPEAYGLFKGARRTPGLRREEVAVLAGVSVDRKSVV